MRNHRPAVRLIFPNQLFADHLRAPKGTTMVLIEDDLFFKQYKFHKQKLVLHRASMDHLAAALHKKGFSVEQLQTAGQSSMARLESLLKHLQPTELAYYELTDDWLQQRMDTLMKKLNISAQQLQSPGFLTSRGQVEDYFDHNPNRMQKFYEWQRRRLNILLDGDKPVGGKWSYDVANRKKLPKNITLPPAYKSSTSQYIGQAQKWVDQTFTDNPGQSQPFRYPVTHDAAASWLEQFVQQRLATFGPYEDAIAEHQGELFHSVLSPLLNCGLLTPQQVVDQVLAYASEHDVPIESLEGFVRQIIGWREYMRATYVQFGRQMRTTNYLEFNNKLTASWWDGTVGITPIDTVIQRVLQTGYAHHIERLMVLGNSMVLLRIHPDQAYEWFMSLFIDAYDWVMVPNVYAMSQFAVGEMITTKPYISGSNYILKMSDFKQGDWSAVWDALYWQFISDHRQMIERNYRMGMVTKIYDRFSDAKKLQLQKTASKWLAS